MLHSYLRKSKAYFDGTRVLIDGGKTFRDFIRVNKDSQRLIKKLIAQVSGVAVPIGPYEPRTAAKHTSNAEQSLHALEKLARKKALSGADAPALPEGEPLASRAALSWTPEAQYGAKGRALLQRAAASGQRTLSSCRWPRQQGTIFHDRSSFAHPMQA